MRELCVLLDLPGKHNWKKLLEHVKNYTHMDVMELSNLAQQARIPFVIRAWFILPEDLF